MVVLVVLLLVTNLVTLGTLAWYLLHSTEHPAPGRAIAAAVDAARPPEVSTTGTRRVITIEILNPIELAGTRGRLVGIAGSLAPGITRRLVYDQAVKTVKRHLADEQVVADVRVHAIRPVPRTAPTRPFVIRPRGTRPDPTAAAAAASSRPGADDAVDVPLFDPAAPVKLIEREDDSA